MYCDFCGKKSPQDVDEVLESYQGEYFCDEDCRDKFRSRFDDNI
jgi:hypothetical protein